MEVEISNREILLILNDTASVLGLTIWETKVSGNLWPSTEGVIIKDSLVRLLFHYSFCILTCTVTINMYTKCVILIFMPCTFSLVEHTCRCICIYLSSLCLNVDHLMIPIPCNVLVSTWH